jgi:hypothetical protein
VGGGGGGGYSLDARELETLRQQAQERFARAEAESEINGYLLERLVEINERDVELVDQRLDRIEAILSERITGFDRLRFGGSVAKHTFVNGLSDVDSLVILRESDIDPLEARQELARTIEAALPRGEIESIKTDFAVTVNFRDGMKLQLLPALQRGQEVAISSEDGAHWMDIHPRGFARALTEVNRAQGSRVVPTVKLAKAVIDGLPEQDRPSGYHVEALAVAAFTSYAGPRTLKDMLAHFFNSASRDVRRPIPDVTGQSRHVDESLGAADSPSRKRLATRFQDVARALEKSVSLREWQALIDG